MSPVVCRRCKSPALYRDDDIASGIAVIACHTCGRREYEGYPTRIRARIKDGNYAPHICGRCGEEFDPPRHANGGRANRQYCDECRDETRMEGFKAYWSRHRKGKKAA